MNDLHKIWKHRWVSTKAKEKNSNIDRNGLIALEDIPVGEAIIVYGGVIIPKSDIDDYRKSFGEYDVPIDENFSIAPTSHDEITATGSVNHSCEPNVGWMNALTLSAIRDIKAGEELATDYAFHGGYPEDMVCKCESKSCRKVIRADDWKRLDLHAKYGKWFMPWVREKFSEN